MQTPINSRRSMWFYQLFGLTGLILVFGTIAAWAAFSSIQGAVIASGTLVVEGYSKQVQHKEGGIILSINVSNGDHVKQGDVLLRLDVTDTKAELAMVSDALNDRLARQARLRAIIAEQMDITFPKQLVDQIDNADVAQMMDSQRKLFKSETSSLTGRHEQLEKRMVQVEDEILGINAQINAKQEQVQLLSGELTDLKTLQEKGLVPVSRILSLQREKARLVGEMGQLRSRIAQSQGRIGETKLQIIQLSDDFRKQSLTELREVDANILEMQERRIAAEERLRRTDIIAPIAGTVHQLQVHTLGGVIKPGETLMMIVPESGDIVIESHVRPQDIDQIHEGQNATLRFPAFNQRSTPELIGQVFQVSADLSQTAKDQPPFYAIRIKVPKEQLDLLGDNKLKPGMPVEAFVQTSERSPMSYLVKPLTDQFARVFRES